MRGLIYCRVSTKEQVENLSLTTQERRCAGYCETNGIEVDRIFHEKGESAKTQDRTVLQEMLDYCRARKGEIQLLIV